MKFIKNVFLVCFNKYKENKQSIFYLTLIFHTFFQLMTIIVLNGMGRYETLFKIGRYICYLIFAFGAFDYYCEEILKNSINKFFEKNFVYFKSHLLLFFFSVLSVISTITSRDIGPIKMLLIFLNVSQYEFDKYIRVIFGVNVFLLISTFFLSQIGILPDILIMRGEKVRHSMGYIYPTEFMSHFCFIFLMYLYISKENYNLLHCIIVNLLNFFIFSYTDSRLDFLVVLFVSIVALLFNKKEILMKKIMNPLITVSIFVLSCVFSFCTAIFYNGNSLMFSKLNTLLSQRLLLGNNAIHFYQIGLFGKNIDWIGSGGVGLYEKVNALDYNFVDCSYIKDMFDYGILLMFLFYFIFIVILFREYKRKNYYILLPITIIFVISIIEPRFLSIPMNPFLLLVSYILVMPNKEIESIFKGERKNGTV